MNSGKEILVTVSQELAAEFGTDLSLAEHTRYRVHRRAVLLVRDGLSRVRGEDEGMMDVGEQPGATGHRLP